MIAAEFREKRKLAGVPLGAISSCQWLVIIRGPTEIEKGKRKWRRRVQRRAPVLSRSRSIR